MCGRRRKLVWLRASGLPGERRSCTCSDSSAGPFQIWANCCLQWVLAKVRQPVVILVMARGRSQQWHVQQCVSIPVTCVWWRLFSKVNALSTHVLNKGNYLDSCRTRKEWRPEPSKDSSTFSDQASGKDTLNRSL